MKFIFQIFATNPIATFIVLPTGEIEFANSAATNLFNITEADVVSTNLQNYVQPDIHSCLQQLNAGLKKSSIQKMSLLNITGKQQEATFNFFVLENDSNKSIGVQIVPIKEYIEPVVISAEDEAIIENSDCYFILISPDLKVLRINRKAQEIINEISGITLQRGANIFTVIAEENKTLFKQIYEEVLTGRPMVEEFGLMVGDINRWYRVTFSPIKDSANNVVSILQSSVDITLQKNSENQLKEIEHRWRLALEGSAQGIWDWDIPTDKVIYSEGWKKLFGYEDGDVPHSYKELQALLHPADKISLQNNIQRHLASGIVSYESEYRVKTKDGSYKWIMSRGIILSYDENKQPIRMIGTHTDIHKRKSIEERYKLIFYDSPLPMWIYDRDTQRFVEVNDATLNLYGYTRDEFINLHLEEIRPAEDIEFFKNTSVKNFKNKSFSFDFVRHKKKNGDIIYVKIFGRELEDEGARHAMVLAEDITEKLLTENRLKESEEHYRLLFKNSPIPAFIYDVNNLNFLEVNTAFIEHYGFKRSELIGQSTFQIHLPEDHIKLTELVKNNIDKTRSLTSNWRHVVKSGEVIQVEATGSTLSYYGTAARLVIINDVTARKNAEQKLKDSNERYFLATKATSDVIWDWSIKSNDILFSDNFENLFGWQLPPNKLVGIDKLIDIVHVKDINEASEKLNRCIKDKSEHEWKDEFNIKRKNGSYAIVKVTGHIVRDDNGMAIRVIGAVQDITEIKLKERDLLESNDRFEFATKATSDVIYDWSTNNNQIQWSQSLEKLFGWRSDELNFDTWEGLIHDADRKRVMHSLQNCLVDPEQKHWKDEYSFKRKDGSYAYVSDRGYIIRYEDGTARRMIGALQDISPLKYQQHVQELELKVLEKNAIPNVSFNEVLCKLIEGFEEIHSGTAVSICLPDSEKEIKFLAPNIPGDIATHLQKSVEQQFNKLLQQPIIKDTHISYLADSEQWPYQRDITFKSNWHRAWCIPVYHYSGVVLALINIYSQEDRNPTDLEVNTFVHIRNLLSLLIVNYLSVDQIRISNERFDNVLKATHDMVWDWNLQSGMFYRNSEGLQRVYGVKEGDSIKLVYDWMKRIHPEDHKKVQRVINNIIHAKTEDTFDVEYRFKSDSGEYFDIYDRGIIIRDREGKPIRMIGAAQNITERKQLEQELLHQEIDRQKLISKATIETQELERSAIGKELHDNVNQVLTTTKLYLDLSLSTPDMKDELIQKSSRNIIYVINEIRQLSRSLMDPSIGDLGLIDSVNDLIESIHLTKKLHIYLDYDDDIDMVLQDNQKLMIFRILQEALNNIIKYAKATTVRVSICKKNNAIDLKIVDDGIGFVLETIKKGIGLKNIQNRVYLANGSLLIDTAPGKGCKILIKFPITNDAN